MRQAKKNLLKVGELAKLVGKTVRAMHLYEELGLLRPSSRSDGNYRLYSRAAVERLAWIQKLQDMGFSLTEIQGFLKNWEGAENGPEGMAHVRAVFGAKLAETRATIERLQRLEQDLSAAITYLETCNVCDDSHSTVSCGVCDQPGHEPGRAPDLVAGLAKPAAFVPLEQLDKRT
jgi:DNA-binding transcriptional MerR regulator